MALDEKQQIFESWKRADSVLVAFRNDPHHDGVGSALALGNTLKKLGKRVEIVSDGWEHKPTSFLPRTETIKSTLGELQKFTIEVDVSKTAIKEFSYDVSDGKLRISLIPKNGTWQNKNVSSRPGNYRFDLICTIGTPDLASLGDLFDNHGDFFSETPIINIDHDAANEHYGQINHVDINSCSCGEVLYELISKLDHHFIDEDMATCLLIGMIGKTRSFKTPNVTPKTLTIASDLVALGGRREEIVNHLYRTRTVPVLRLWGRALARLKHDAPTKLVWTLLSRQDFITAGADASALAGVIDELIINAPEARLAAILYENPSGAGTSGLLHAERPLNALEFGKFFSATGNRETVAFEIKDKPLIEAEPFVTNLLKERLSKLSKMM